MQLAEARQRQAGEQVLDRSMQPYQPNGPQEEGAPPAQAQHPYLDDNNLWDIPKLSGMLADRGYAHLAPDLLASAERMNKSVTEHQDAVKKEADARTVMYGDYADGIQQLVKAGATPADAIETIGKQAVGSGRIKPQEFEQFKSQLLALPPDQLDPALNTAKSQAERIAPSETLAEGAKRVGRYGSTLGSNAPPTGKGGYTINGQRFAEDGTPIGKVQPTQTAPKDYQKSSVLLDGKPAEILTDPAPGGKIYDLDHKVIENAATRIKPIPSAAAVSITSQTLSQAALDQAAQKYLESGSLPPGMGMGPQRTAIMNRAAEIDPKAALARNAAVYKADQANLTKLQTTEGTLSAFENTAGKNLNQFLETAAKIPDVGVPWINAPLRTIDAKLLGSTDQAAFNAARDVALREIARVTNDPKLSGALTDSARAEVAGLSPANATFAQIKRVAEVLKQDMANVHSGLREQIATVKAGIGGQTGAPPPNPKDPMGVR